MGGVLKRWRREESAEEVLQSLEKQLQKLESAQQKDEQFYQRFVGRLMFYSILLYIAAAVIFYLYYFPKQWKDRIIRTIPLLVFPLLIYGIRKVLQHFFSRRKKKNALKLEELRSKKQKVIENVKEKETYKKAKEILEKFDPDSSLLKNDVKQEASNGKVFLATPGTEVRQRNGSRTVSTPSTSSSHPPVPFSATPMRPVASPPRGMSPAMQRQFFVNNVPTGTPPGPPKPILVIPKERTVADKFVDYLVGDGPNNRYALICKACHSHNGMALMEDFAFTTFRCCYCYQLNEAKKERPLPPPLEGFSSPNAEKQNLKSAAVNGSEEHSAESGTPLEDVEDGTGKKSGENCSDSEANGVENISAIQENSEL